jgi:DNA-binding transcriptional MerR regulator
MSSDPDATADDAPQPVFRSAAVARRAGMPVATLRIWEQRHRAVRPATAPSGHRLYSPADVARVLLLRRLTAEGHAIGSIAGLDTGRLRRLATSTAANASTPGHPAGPLRLVVIGRTLATRLQRPAVTRRLAAPARVVAVFDTPEAAAAGAADALDDGLDPPDGVTPLDGIDLLLWQVPGLPARMPPTLVAAGAAWRARRTAVVHRFAGAAARRAFEDEGALVLREPLDDEALGAWLATHGARPDPRSEDMRDSAAPLDVRVPAADAVPPRRFDDATLTAIAGLPSSVACECPRHVAELLMQLAGFEAYSAQCASRGPADAALHADLHQVAGRARALFESALERVARHEGLSLPRGHDPSEIR